MDPLVVRTMQIPAAALLLALASADGSKQPVELGRVQFGRDLDAGLAAAKHDQKPVFLQFQEIPGCQTCRDFGGGPLSHPLLVEAIETCFVPIVIHNNADGADAAALKRFGEPAWNNPVVRFVNGDGRDLIPRRDGAWSTGEIAERMVAALEAAREDVPRWLDLARLETNASSAQRVAFAMHCFWEGQSRLGAIDGVIDARPGFVDGREVVDVRFDGQRVKLSELARRAAELDCARDIFVTRPDDITALPSALRDRARVLSGEVRAAGASDDLRALRRVRDLDLLPLTRLQALRANAELTADGDVRAGTLTPRQAELRRRIASASVERTKGLARPDDARELGRYADELNARLTP